MKNKNIIKNYIIGPYPSKSYKTKLIALTLCIITFILSCNIYLSFKNLFIANDLFKNPIHYTAMKNSSLESPLILSDQENLHSINLKAIDVEEINENKTEYEEKIYVQFLILFISFITLASVHNFFIDINENKKFSYKEKTYLIQKSKKTTPQIKLTSSSVSKEGAK